MGEQVRAAPVLKYKEAEQNWCIPLHGTVLS